jgi:glycosyltransferase involved in cell wall biosynthesis
MRVALIVPPFIPVPPARYGGTELFVAHLAEEIGRQGHSAVVYATGESTVNAELRSLYARGEWPLRSEIHGSLTALNHGSWAVRDAVRDCDLLHLNHAVDLAFTRFINRPTVYTLHHPYDAELAELYRYFPRTRYVAISHAQARRNVLPRLSVIRHGIDLNGYQMGAGSREFAVFIGRIAPEKGTHIAIEVAKRAGVPLKIAGQIQPIYKEYWETKVKPQLDGNIEYVGEADLETKNELLGGAVALLFPIMWDEPFGLIMIEAMACGTPVLAFNAGSVPEIVRDGVSGWICSDLKEMAKRLGNVNVAASQCRDYVAREFTVERMTREYIQLYESSLADHRLAKGRSAVEPIPPFNAADSPAVIAAQALTVPRKGPEGTLRIRGEDDEIGDGDDLTDEAHAV